MKSKILKLLILGTLACLILGACSQESASLDGSSWTLQSYRDSSGDTVRILARSTVTALFQTDTVTGIAGCNNYNASYQVNRNKLSFGPTATTRKVCSSPTGIMQQEIIFLSNLNSITAYKLKSNSLEMIDGQGNTMLVFKKASDQ